ncbi:raf homolog serine/threonine-protein kinase-like [Clytia hemisphaerica]|uniref:raf homolog serine/threonine-protein kinase-like n=1 Tax=Clytia hemisphaerica TaxID=252671 RepID=UPI0034D3968F
MPASRRNLNVPKSARVTISNSGVRVLNPQQSSPNEASNRNNSEQPLNISGVAPISPNVTPSNAPVQRKSKRSIVKRKERRVNLRNKQKISKDLNKTSMREMLISAKRELKFIQRKAMVPAPARLAFTEKARSSRSKRKKTCQNELLTSLSSNLAKFSGDRLRKVVVGFENQKGVFGEISVRKIDFLGVYCARKSIRGSAADLRSEALVLLKLSGHPCFPFLYGMEENHAILMEYISGKKNTLAPSLTLSDVIRNKTLLSTRVCFEICRKLVAGMTYLHDNGILHNDLHGRNIILRPDHSPCIVDFGKATLVTSPIIYNLTYGSKEQILYNKVHRHLAYELRNVPNSPQTPQTDVYSLGYNFESILKINSHKDIKYVAGQMMKKDPISRFNLNDCSVNLMKE